jgi:hypothetical protein
MTIEMFLEMVSTPVLILLWVTVFVKLMPIWIVLLAVLGLGKK